MTGFDPRVFGNAAREQLATRPNGGHAPGGASPEVPDPERLCLTPARWAERDIPPPDRLLGDVFTTTTRTQLSADTGLGKTMLALAVNFAMRTGSGFLGWHAHREARVMILDGEMPPELIKDRLAAAASWFGVGEPITDGLYLLSREDVEDMPPLDTPEGARWLLAFMDRLGRIDHATFDNVACLTAQSMKEEEGERALAELRREITARQTGQFWLHHTGHDASRGYGTKVREWHLDTVMVAEKLDAPDTDVALTLKFPKSRRRTPDNRADFDEREVVLKEGRWEHRGEAAGSGGAARPGKGGKLPDGALMALAALRKALTELGKPPPASSGTIGVHEAVTLDQWRDMFARMAPYGTGQEEARKKAFRRGADRVVADGLARKWGPFVWLRRRDHDD